MDSLKLYLTKFKDLRPPNDVLKEAIQVSIKKVVGVELDKKAITVQNWTVFIKAPSALKSELYIHQEQIMETLETELGRKSIKKIL